VVNITDIARQVGVSPSTVSRVVNGKPYVNAEKKAQILKIIEETGYVPSNAARSMAMERSFSIGIIIPDTFNIFQRQLFSIIERNLVSFGYYVLFFFVKPDAASEEECLTRLKKERLSGIIMLHEMKDDGFFRYLEQAEIPAVYTIDNVTGLTTVTIDDRQAAKDAVGHLTSLGHKKINMIGGSGFFTFDLKRMEGYRKALETAGLDYDDMRLVHVPLHTMESGMYGMRELMLRSRDFTAVFVDTDELALGAIRTLTDHHIRVPEDVSVIGFDDIDIANYFCPRLTTVRQPLREIGEQSALTLHRLIAGRNPVSNAAAVILPHHLIIRESTCALTR
jgi:LacI family transcriptional regulator